MVTVELRVALGDYIHEQLAIASATGVQLNRYLWHDFPEDSVTWDMQVRPHTLRLVRSYVPKNSKNRKEWSPKTAKTYKNAQDEFMFGSDYLVAPIVEQKTLSRSVYFPKGTSWEHYKTGKVHAGGSTATVLVPLDGLAMFKRTDAASPFVL